MEISEALLRSHGAQQRDGSPCLLGMVDDWSGVFLAQGDARAAQRLGRSIGREMDVAGVQPDKLRAPLLDELALRIELAALQDGIEDSEVRLRVGAHRSRPLPSP